MAADFQTAALVMGSHKLSDADRVVSLFTEANGRVPTVVKGVRKVSSRFGGRLEPLSLLTVRLHQGRNLATLTAADTISTGASIRDNRNALQAGLSVIELLARTTTEHERRPRTWNLLQRFHPLMENAAKRAGEGNAVISVALGAELKLLLLAGFLPHIANCSICGTTGAPLTRFSAAAGGSICPDCPGESFTVTAGMLEKMGLLLEQPLAEAPSLETSQQECDEIWRCIREICRHHLGTNLKVRPWF
jgi:DNA repair protein RecO (recombination protein O)